MFLLSRFLIPCFAFHFPYRHLHFVALLFFRAHHPFRSLLSSSDSAELKHIYQSCTHIIRPSAETVIMIPRLTHNEAKLITNLCSNRIPFLGCICSFRHLILLTFSPTAIQQDPHLFHQIQLEYMQIAEEGIDYQTSPEEEDDDIYLTIDGTYRLIDSLLLSRYKVGQTLSQLFGKIKRGIHLKVSETYVCYLLARQECPPTTLEHIKQLYFMDCLLEWTSELFRVEQQQSTQLAALASIKKEQQQERKRLHEVK